MGRDRFDYTYPVPLIGYAMCIRDDQRLYHLTFPSDMLRCKMPRLVT